MASIQGIYIALFGRPADPTGLAYFNGVTQNGADLSAIGDLASTDEYQDRFEGNSNVQIVTAIYQSLFGRDPEAAGLEFFVAALNNGTYSINNIAIAILDGAQGDDLATVNKKIEAANLFTAEIDTAVEIGSYIGDDAAEVGRTYLAGIDKDSTPTQADAADAVEEVVEKGVAGNTFTILLANNVVVGDGAADSTNNNDTITVDAAGDYDASNAINGGLGKDTVKVSTSGFTTTATSLVGVERLDITAVAGGGGGVADLDATSGLEQVRVVNSGVNAIEVAGIDTDVAVRVVGANDDVTITYNDVGGSSDAATVALAGNVATGLDVAGIEALTLDVKEVSSVALAAGDAETITVTGSGDLTLTAVGGLFNAESIDGSDHIGKLIVTTGAVTGELSVEGGASNDVFNVTAAAQGVTLIGNGGSDLFNVDTISGITGATAEELETSLEDDIIVITDFNGSEDTLDITLSGLVDDLTNVQLSDIAAAETLADALGVAAAAVGANASVAFQWEGSTYIYQNDAQAAFDAGDGLVQLVGFTGDLTDANFVA